MRAFLLVLSSALAGQPTPIPTTAEWERAEREFLEAVAFETDAAALPKPVAHAVREALAILAGCSGLIAAGQDHHPPHPPAGELATFYSRVYETAPLGSQWAGVEASREWWVACAWVVAQHEYNQHNSDVNCQGGAPGNRRSAGFVSFTGPLWRRTCDRLGFPHAEPACWETVRNPGKQGKVFVGAFARILRERHGDVRAAWQYWRYGKPSGDDYASVNRDIWRKRWPKVPCPATLPTRWSRRSAT